MKENACKLSCFFRRYTYLCYIFRLSQGHPPWFLGQLISKQLPSPRTTSAHLNLCHPKMKTSGRLVLFTYRNHRQHISLDAKVFLANILLPPPAFSWTSNMGTMITNCQHIDVAWDNECYDHQRVIRIS